MDGWEFGVVGVSGYVDVCLVYVVLVVGMVVSEVSE